MNKNNQKRRKNARPKRALRSVAKTNKQVIVSVPKRPKLSPCALEYLRSLIDPFDLSLSPCLPDMVTLDSRKAVVFTRGTVSTGTTGFGFICVNPFRMAVNNTGGTGAIFVTLPTYPGTDIDLNNALVTTSNIGSNSDYSTGSTDLVSYRLISAGLRLRYNGTELTRNGTVSLLQDPNHSSLEGQTFTSIQAHDHAKILPVTRAWSAVTYSPVFPVELGYMNVTRVPSPQTQSPTVFPATTSLDNPYCMAAVMNTLTGANIGLWDYEVVAHFEFTGEGARGKSRSESDPLGFAAVQNAAPQGAYVGSPSSSVLQGIKDATFNLMSMSGNYLSENPHLVGAGVEAVMNVAAGKKSLPRIRQLEL